MKKHILIAFLALSCSASAQTIRRIDGSRIDTAHLSRNIKQLMAKARVTGLGLVVYNNNEPVFRQTYGWANVPGRTAFTADRVLYAASFSKTVFAYICGQLVKEKVIDLDRPLVTYLPGPLPDYVIPGFKKGYADLRNDRRYEKITARMCLSHTTGFPNWRWFEPDGKLKIAFEPGSRYSYSGEGLSLLQFVIEQITGKDYETIAEERVFNPLGMRNSSYLWRPDFAAHLILGHNKEGKPYELMHWKEAGCAGTMSTTLDDYAKFFTALLNDPELPGIISPQIRIRSIKQFGPLSRKDSTLDDHIQLGYGLGVGVFQTRYGPAFFKEGHDDGWGHYSVAYPEKGIAVVIMTNSDAGESIFKALLADSIGDVFTPWEWEDYIPA